MIDAHFLRVFTDSNGNFGDVASVVIDEGKHIDDAKRQEIARELNTGETIFINDLATVDISIVHPQGEIGFAGVGVVGTAWLLAKLRGNPTERMQSRDGEIAIWQAGDITWARGPLSIMPPWSYRQLENAEAVEQIKLEDTSGWRHTMAWAWIDEAKGLIRARTFAADWDIPEAEGNGSGSMVLAARLNQEIEIRHGKGAVIFAKPAADGQADIGGRIVETKGSETLAYTIRLPEYRVASEPDYKAIGKIVDDEVRKHFTGRTIVARGIGSSEHPGKTINELVEIIKRDGTDRYDPNRRGDRYETIGNKHIDLFGFRCKVGPHMQLFKDVVYGFYHSALGIHGKAVRIDILIIYDAAKLKAVLHQYEGRTDKKRDGFVFREPVRKQDALLGIIKIN